MAAPAWDRATATVGTLPGDLLANEHRAIAAAAAAAALSLPDRGVTAADQSAGASAIGHAVVLADLLGVEALAKPQAVTPVANMPAVIGTPSAASVTEDQDVVDGRISVSGTIPISDADAGEAMFRTTVKARSFNLGTLTLAADGHYTYSVDDAAVQFLRAGRTRMDKFVVTADDGTTADVFFTITGTNDAAVIGAHSVAAVTEDVNVVDGKLTASGVIPISDVDVNDASFRSVVKARSSNLGALTLAADGHYNYTVDNGAVHFLHEGQTRQDKFVVTAHDGTTADIYFTLTGVNDAPVVTGPVHAAAIENRAGLRRRPGSQPQRRRRVLRPLRLA